MSVDLCRWATTRSPARCGGFVVALSMAFTMFAGARPSFAQTPAPSTNAVSTGILEQLQFLDGGILHGLLEAVSTDAGVRWQHPSARQPIEFGPTNLAWIGFENTTPIALPSKPTCRFRFNNGDELFGNLAAMDMEKLEFETWFGGNLRTPRSALQSIVFFPQGVSILYEGPTSLEGWSVSKGTNTWRYRDGAFLANGTGTLGRDLKLQGSATFEFDLAWSGQFSVILALYTDVVNRFDYSATGYMVYFGPGYLNVQRMQPGSGTIVLGQTSVPSMLRRSKTHFEIRASKEESAVAIYADGALLQRWRDNAGFAGRGSGIVFSTQIEGSSLRLSNLKIAEWNGKFEEEIPANPPAQEDFVRLVNRDKVSGVLSGFRDGKILMAAAQTKLEIPLQRVTQIFFGAGNTNRLARSPWEVRAYFSGGGSVSMQLEKWSRKQLAGSNPDFGHLVFDARSIRRLQFNLDRVRVGDEPINSEDETKWEMEEGAE